MGFIGYFFVLIKGIFILFICVVFEVVFNIFIFRKVLKIFYQLKDIKLNLINFLIYIFVKERQGEFLFLLKVDILFMRLLFLDLVYVRVFFIKGMVRLIVNKISDFLRFFSRDFNWRDSEGCDVELIELGIFFFVVYEV